MLSQRDLQISTAISTVDPNQYGDLANDVACVIKLFTDEIIKEVLGQSNRSVDEVWKLVSGNNNLNSKAVGIVNSIYLTCIKEIEAGAADKLDLLFPNELPDFDNRIGFKTKFGGTPDWINPSNENVVCDGCNSPLTFVCQVDSLSLVKDGLDGYIWGDAGMLYTFWCKKCGMGKVINDCF